MMRTTDSIAEGRIMHSIKYALDKAVHDPIVPIEILTFHIATCCFSLVRSEGQLWVSNETIIGQWNIRPFLRYMWYNQTVLVESERRTEWIATCPSNSWSPLQRPAKVGASQIG